jgi:hypothetical protein
MQKALANALTETERLQFGDGSGAELTAVRRGARFDSTIVRRTFVGADQLFV